MLLVSLNKQVLTSGDKLVVSTRVIGHSGRRLVAYIDDEYYKICQLPDDLAPYYPITSSDLTKTITFTVGYASPERALKIVIMVTDENNNIYERAIFFIIVSPTIATLTFTTKADILYITGDGVIINNRSTVAYLNNLSITIIRIPGRLIIYNGLTKTTDIAGKSALITLKITIPLELAKLYSSYISDYDVSSILVKEPTLTYWLGAIAYIEKVIKEIRASIISMYPEKQDSYITITITANVDLYSNFDWDWVIKGAIIAGAIVASGLIIYGTAGLGAPLAVKVTLGAISLTTVGYLTYNYLSEEKPTQILQQAEVTIKEASGNMLKYKGDLENYLNQLVAQGKITVDEKNKIMDYVNSIIQTALDTFESLKNMITSAYNEGYNKAKQEMMKWVAIAGVGGFALGYISGE